MSENSSQRLGSLALSPRLLAHPVSPSCPGSGSLPSPSLDKDPCALGGGSESSQLSKSRICELGAPPSGWLPCQGLFPHLLEVSQHCQEPLVQLIKERESTYVCTQGHTTVGHLLPGQEEGGKWGTSMGQRQGASPVKHPRRPGPSPGPGEGWDRKFGHSAQLNQPSPPQECGSNKPRSEPGCLFVPESVGEQRGPHHLGQAQRPLSAAQSTQHPV